MDLNFENALKCLDIFKNECQWCSISIIKEENEYLSVKNQTIENFSSDNNIGIRVEVFHNGHISYASTNSFDQKSIINAFRMAHQRAINLSRFAVHSFDIDKIRPAHQSNIPLSFSKDSIDSYIDLFTDLTKPTLNISLSLAKVQNTKSTKHYHSSSGAHLFEQHEYIYPSLYVIGKKADDNQTRSWEIYKQLTSENDLYLNRDFAIEKHEAIIKECNELLDAKDCPNKQTDLILMPDQMLLQIHESIGHPLELDRILGDEFNYAGSSFVNLSDFNSLEYGSSLLNVSFDPSYQSQSASYQYDDTGNQASKEYLIKEGKLLRSLGSLESQCRTDIDGVANARSCSWNRPPIDRMANINLEAGESSLLDIIKNTEDGILMHTNKSWSIDDYRLKFQFGCEYANLIKDGEVSDIVKNPNYHGITTSFWHQLDMLGDADTIEHLGTPFCGKGEPNQVIPVGHASPPARFKNIEVFGGHK